MASNITRTTLCLVHNDTHILLGMKKRGFGAGRWNGFGGKLKGDETVERAAQREMFEESGIEVQDLEKVGILNFEFETKPGDVIEVNIFRAHTWKGEPGEGEEMRPQWWKLEEIPFSSMWPDDSYWMPLFLSGKKFSGRFLFGENDSIVEYSLSVDLNFNQKKAIV